MRPWFAPDFRRFLPAWIAFATAVSLAFFVLALPASVWELFDPSGEITDAAPVLVIVVCVAVYFSALPIGAVVVPFRHWFVGPRFPFLRWGYLPVACAPLGAWLLPEQTLGSGAVLLVGLEIYLLLSAA